ncbi:STAS domain-containing protein [Streptomyces sp. WAC07149]|uniref:STAS domain-containing protein n=1 Tax=Streptomyces sp. WAC07149 TaxID=2487425 RepID=UPI000F7665DE|nr:STAS domain-containing protein [Streptomyces sp. WAC07149]RST06300.1 STAS domain-containing protein [Streptomyces sp. WAC07149]
MSSAPADGHPPVEITLALEGPHPDVPALRARVRQACRDAPGQPVSCDARRVTAPTLATVEALARMALTAKRHGAPFTVTGAAPRLQALLHLVGLGELLRQPEQREPPRRVQEGVQPDDPPL